MKSSQEIQKSVLGSEVDENGYFIRQKNIFTKEFGADQKSIESNRYLIVWAKICQWSNRASIVFDLLGLKDDMYITIVDKDVNKKHLGWQFNNLSSELKNDLKIKFLDEAYLKANPRIEGRGTVPAVIDLKTQKVINNDYHNLTYYLERNFSKYHKNNAPILFPKNLKKEIQELNKWLFHNINNSLYRTTFCTSKEGYWEPYSVFYSGMEIINNRLQDRRFLFGDYITDSDIQLYTTLSRLDIRYTIQLGHTYKRLVDYDNLWPYMRDLYQINAFKNNTYFHDFANPPGNQKTHHLVKEFNERFLNQINFESIWNEPHQREHLSQDSETKFYFRR